MDKQNHSSPRPATERERAGHIGQILDDAQTEIRGGRWDNVVSLLRHAVAEACLQTQPTVSVVATSSLTADRARSQSLRQGFAILAVLQQHGGGLIGVVEVADATGMTRSTAHRYMRTLLELGQIEQDPTTRKYRAVAS
jgi:Fic family protein